MRNSKQTTKDDGAAAADVHQKQRRKQIVTVAAVAALGGVLVYGEHSYKQTMQQSITGDPVLIDKGQKYIAALSKDPASVQFEDVRETHHCVTGKLNAKNSFGAYVGFRDFYYDDDRNVGQISPASMNDAAGNFDIDAAHQTVGYSDGLLQCTAGHDGDPAYGRGNVATTQ